MKRTSAIRSVILGALLAAYGASAAAQAIDEFEPNYPDAQRLVRGADGTMSVKGAIGVREFWAAPVQDVDLYSFYAHEGDVLTFDIDGGIKSSTMFGAPRSVNTMLTVLGPSPEFVVQRQALTCLAGVYGASISMEDPCILNFRAEKSGIYVVAVTGEPVSVIDGGNVVGDMPSTNGEYLLIVTGASDMPAPVPPAPPAPPAPAPTTSPVAPTPPAPLVINIDIKPGSRLFAPINPKSKGNIPVALLSNANFNALEVDRGSLTFGATGNEDSFRKCAWEGKDVNGDLMLDLVCHFETEMTGFKPQHGDGVLKGTIGGRPFEGSGALKILPAPKKQK